MRNDCALRHYQAAQLRTIVGSERRRRLRAPHRARALFGDARQSTSGGISIGKCIRWRGTSARARAPVARFLHSRRWRPTSSSAVADGPSHRSLSCCLRHTRGSACVWSRRVWSLRSCWASYRLRRNAVAQHVSKPVKAPGEGVVVGASSGKSCWMADSHISSASDVLLSRCSADLGQRSSERRATEIAPVMNCNPE